MYFDEYIWTIHALDNDGKKKKSCNTTSTSIKTSNKSASQSHGTESITLVPGCFGID